MNLPRAHRVFAWIALLAITLAALAPTLSRTLVRGAAGPAGWIEVCTASGMQWINLASAATSAGPDADGAGQSQPTQGAMLDRCPFCLLAGDRLGPASDAPVRFFVPGDPVAPLTGLPPSFCCLASLAAHARGPPLNTSAPSVA